jgi:hypothetical protein
MFFQPQGPMARKVGLLTACLIPEQSLEATSATAQTMVWTGTGWIVEEG